MKDKLSWVDERVDEVVNRYSFPGHKGVKGQLGGSAPRGEGGGAEDRAIIQRHLGGVAEAAIRLNDGTIVRAGTGEHIAAIREAYTKLHGRMPFRGEKGWADFEAFRDSFYGNEQHGIIGYVPFRNPTRFITRKEIAQWGG